MHELYQIRDITFEKISTAYFRVMYVAKFAEAVYVLHCFKKKMTSTSKRDKDIAAARYKAVIQERSKR